MKNGSFNTSAYSSRYLKFSWWTNKQDINGNYTDIGWNLVGAGGGSTWFKSGNFKVIIDNEQVYFSSTRIELHNGTIVASGTKRIYHNSKGEKTFNAYAEAGIYNNAVNVSGSGSWKLDDIPRQANITNSPSSFSDEDNPWFSYSNPADAALSCWLEPNPNGEHICERTLNGTSGTYTWNLTEEERIQLRERCNSNSCIVRIGLYSTIGNTTYASYHDRTMNIVNGNPVFTNFEYKDTNNIVTAVTGNNQVLVQGLSTVQAIIKSIHKMIAKKQSIAKNYVITIDDINKSVDYSVNDLNINLGVISSSGKKRLNIRAYDSRNNSTLAYKDIIIYDYAKPVINATATRLNNFENETTLKVSGTYSKLTIDNVDKNIITKLQYRNREANGTWSSWKTLTSKIVDGKFSCDDVILSLDNTKAFDFEIQAVDKLQTTTLSLKLDIGQAVFLVSSNKKACYINGQEILTYDIVDSW